MVARNDQTGNTECIIEAFVLKSHDSTVIATHIEKLLNTYDTVGNKNNYAITYVKSEKSP
jgi:hypothetical protein